jgi:hypothetical protein
LLEDGQLIQALALSFLTLDVCFYRLFISTND